MHLIYLTILVVLNVAGSVFGGGLEIVPKPDNSNKVTASIDDRFMLSCVSSGSNEDKPKALQWKSPTNQLITADFDKRVYTMLNGDTLRLYFDKLLPSDSGTYSCTGVEAGVPRESRVELVLQKKISFVDSPVSQFIKGGSDQVVICKATANPGPEITWFRKGVNIEIKNDNKYQVTNDGLMIKNAQAEDEGVYYCQATVTSTGEVKRLEIDVQVMSAPKWIIEPKDTEGVNGQDVIIKCEAFAKPAPVYTWTRNGVQLAGDRYLVNGGTLTVRNLHKEDTATYSCVAENNSGRIEASLKLFVLIAPEIPFIEDVRVVEGNSAILRCNIREAYPKAKIEWKYADTQEYIVEGDNFKIVNDNDEALENVNSIGGWSELHIAITNRLNKRNYTCVATNKAAVSERQIQLLVEYKPKLLINNEAKELYYSWIYTDNFGTSGNSASQTSRAYPVVFTCIADAEPSAVITWYFKGAQIKPDLKYKLLKDEPSYSRLEVNPTSIDDFGDYQCKAENRLGREERNIQLREATTPKFAPLIKLKEVKPESIVLDIYPSDAAGADGGMQIEAYKIQWKYQGAEWSNVYEKEIPLDINDPTLLTTQLRDAYNVEVTSLMPDTEYLFRAAAVNKPGVGKWSEKELKLKTAPRRQPDPVKVISKEDCQASTRCYIEWTVESNGGSPIREYMIRYRRIAYKDPNNLHLNTNRIESWSATKIVKAPLTNYEILQLAPNSFYEVDVLARNDIGPSASQPFRIKTLPSSLGEAEAYEKKGASKINKGVIIAASIIGALILFLVIDVVCLVKNNCGILYLMRKVCDNEKMNSNEYKTKSPPPKIAQHQPKSISTTNSSQQSKPSKSQYQPINQNDDSQKVTINLNA